MKMARVMPLVALLIISLVVALIACGLTRHSLHFYYDRSDYVHLAFKVYGPALAWLLLVIVGFRIHGWKGLWLLLGAPFALLWPIQFTILNIQCWRGFAPSFMCT
jgi:hypothetical protein